MYDYNAEWWREGNCLLTSMELCTGSLPTGTSFGALTLTFMGRYKMKILKKYNIEI